MIVSAFFAKLRQQMPLSRLFKLFKRKCDGNKKAIQNEAVSAPSALQKISETEQMLLGEQEFLEMKMEAELVMAKKHGTANKRLALQALRKRKQYEMQLIQVDKLIGTLQNRKNMIENATMNAEVVKVLRNTAKAVKQAHNGMDADKVHDLMEDVAEQQDLADEIAQAISTPIDFRCNIDEDELLAELEQIEQEKLLDSLPRAVTSEIQLPKAADKKPIAVADKPTKAKSKEKDELKELEAWATL